MRKNGMQDAGVKNLLGVLRAALSQAVRWGWASSNVAALARLRSTKTQQRGVISVDDVKAVMAAAATIDPAAELAFRIAVAGTRRAELASLKWTDEKDGQLLIDSAIEIVKRNVETPQVRETATKTANTRSVTLDDDTLDLLAKLRAERSPYGPWMFGLGPNVVRPDHIGWWCRSRQIAGIDEKWRLHDLRHWSATVAIGQGHDVRTVAGRLGHANPALTFRVYAHAFAAADQAVALGLGNILRGDSNEPSPLPPHRRVRRRIDPRLAVPYGVRAR
jgi:integrase